LVLLQLGIFTSNQAVYPVIGRDWALLLVRESHVILVEAPVSFIWLSHWKTAKDLLPQNQREGSLHIQPSKLEGEKLNH
jgi:hypothetical protein